MTVRAVIDAQVWVSAALNKLGAPRAIVDEFALSGRLRIVSSIYVHDKVLDVFRRPEVAGRLPSRFDAAEWLALVEAAAVDFAEESSGPPLIADPKDNPYLWAAFVGGASHVVTKDREILAVKHYRGAQVIDPVSFLRELRRLV